MVLADRMNGPNHVMTSRSRCRRRLVPALPFWCSIVVLSIIQGHSWRCRGPGRGPGAPGPFPVGVVGRHPGCLACRRGVRAPAAYRRRAAGLIYLALVAVPVLAGAALGWAMRGARPGCGRRGTLFAVAWAWPASLGGDTAALALTALSCVALGVILVGLAPGDAVAGNRPPGDRGRDSGRLRPAAAPEFRACRRASHRPAAATCSPSNSDRRSWDMGISSRPESSARFRQPARGTARAAVLIIVLALVGDLAFLRISEFPATVPVAIGMLIVDAVAPAGWIGNIFVTPRGRR